MKIPTMRTETLSWEALHQKQTTTQMLRQPHLHRLHHPHRNRFLKDPHSHDHRPHPHHKHRNPNQRLHQHKPHTAHKPHNQ